MCTYSVNVGHDGHTDPIVTGPPIYKPLENGMLTLFIVDIYQSSHIPGITVMSMKHPNKATALKMNTIDLLWLLVTPVIFLRFYSLSVSKRSNGLASHSY